MSWHGELVPCRFINGINYSILNCIGVLILPKLIQNATIDIPRRCCVTSSFWLLWLQFIPRITNIPRKISMNYGRTFFCAFLYDCAYVDANSMMFCLEVLLRWFTRTLVRYVDN